MSETATPVVLTSVAQPVQARASLNAAQVEAFKALLASANLVTFPAGKTAEDVAMFAVNVQLNGGGFLTVGIK